MTIKNTALFISNENIHVRGVIIVWLFTKRTVLNSNGRSMRISVFDLMLIEKLLDRNFGSVEFGLVDEQFVFEENDRLILWQQTILHKGEESREVFSFDHIEIICIIKKSKQLVVAHNYKRHNYNLKHYINKNPNLF